MRLFIAARIDKEIEKQIGDFLNQFHKIPCRIKWVEPHNVHITLKFLGETEPRLLEPIKQAIQDSIQGASPFEISFQDCGVFPNMRAPRVFWIGINDPQKRLTEIAKKLDSNLTALGFEPEKRGFSPHLTLGRAKEGSQVDLIKNVFAKATFGPIPLRVEAVSLIESQLRPAGPIYKDLNEFSLSH